MLATIGRKYNIDFGLTGFVIKGSISRTIHFLVDNLP